MMPECITQNIAQPHRKPAERRVDLAEKDVDAACAWKRRRQFGAGERAEKRQDARHDPDQQHADDVRNVMRDF